jgi:hypothetical protein
LSLFKLSPKISFEEKHKNGHCGQEYKNIRSIALGIPNGKSFKNKETSHD